jgi:hypothetical protein
MSTTAMSTTAMSTTAMSTTAMAQPPVKLRCVDRLRLATDYAGDLR